MNRIMKRMAVPVGAAIILGSSGFAFMNSNTVQTSYAGAGTGDISGYVVAANGIHYETTPGVAGAYDVIQAVTFNLDHVADAANVSAVIGGQGGKQFYSTCTAANAASTAFRCAADTPNNIGHTDTADHLTVLAAQ